MTEIRELLKEHIQKNSETWICYDIDRGTIDINGSSYSVVSYPSARLAEL
jgi:hypothetical protein